MERSAHSQQVNDWLQVGAAAEDEMLDLLCECTAPDCRATVSATRERYLRTRDEDSLLLVAAGHEQPGERVVYTWGEVLVVAPSLAAPLGA